MTTTSDIRFSNPHIFIAGKAGLGRVEALLNLAYRGEASKKGWTSEADYIEGDIRATAETVLEVFNKPGSVFLLYKAGNTDADGCVNLQQHGNRIYLGMFAVSPAVQGGGIGKQLLSAAEEYASQTGCRSIYMTVIDIRAELISWYKRHGYQETGERIPFHEDGETGRHRVPLQFMVLEKFI